MRLEAKVTLAGGSPQDLVLRGQSSLEEDVGV